MKGLLFCVLSFHNQYSYSELSILVFFILSRDTPAEVHLLPFYFNLQQICYIIMFNYIHHRTLLLSLFSNLFLSFVFLNTMFVSDKLFYNLPIIDILQTVNTGIQSLIRGWTIVVREIVNSI